ncbi:hypothetical protein I204_05427 [Kwoniella mangroviensis CBS 8886]|nr:hypothetical protein I204_05427 [Kwoniella mangroviensis CBS 8886]
MSSFQSTPDSNQYSRTSAPEQSTHGASEKNKMACLTCRRGKTKCETTEGKESCKRCTRLKKSNCSLSSDARPFASVAEQVASYLKIYRYSKDFIAKGAVSSNNSFLSPTSVSRPRLMSPSRVIKPRSTAQADAALGWGDKSSCGNCRRRKIKCRTLPGQEECEYCSKDESKTCSFGMNRAMRHEVKSRQALLDKRIYELDKRELSDLLSYEGGLSKVNNELVSVIGPQFSLVASQTPADSHFPSSLPPQSSDLPALLAEDVGPITAYLQTEEGRQLLSDYLEEIEQGTNNHGSERTVSTMEVSPVAVFAPPISDDGGFDAIDPTVGMSDDSSLESLLFSSLDELFPTHITGYQQDQYFPF